MTKYDSQKLQIDLVFIFQYNEDDDKTQVGPNGKKMKCTENKGPWNMKDKDLRGQGDKWIREGQCAFLSSLSFCR